MPAPPIFQPGSSLGSSLAMDFSPSRHPARNFGLHPDAAGRAFRTVMPDCLEIITLRTQRQAMRSQPNNQFSGTTGVLAFALAVGYHRLCVVLSLRLGFWSYVKAMTSASAHLSAIYRGNAEATNQAFGTLGVSVSAP